MPANRIASKQNFLSKLVNTIARLATPKSELAEQSFREGTINAIHRYQSIVEFQLDGTILTANENFLKASGYRLDELTGKHHRILVENLARSKSDTNDLWNELANGREVSGVFQCADRNGKQIWFEGTYTPLFDSHNKPCKVMFLATDVTERHRMQTELDDLRVCAQIVNMTSIVSEADLKGDIVSINEKFIEVSKYSREELIGKPHNTTRHPDMPKEVFKELWSSIGRGNTFRGVIKNRAKDGTPYYVDAVIAPVMGTNGKPQKYIGVRYDITASEIERQNAKGILAAIDSTSAYVEFNTSGNVISANEIFLKTMGYRMDEVVGKHHRIFVEPSFANSSAYAQFWNDLNAGQSKSDVFKRMSKDGKEVWIQAVYAPVKDEMGRVSKIIKIATDVTVEKQKTADFEGQLAAISKSQATISFNLDGTVLSANENFCATVGYSLDEIQGKHHRIFCDSTYSSSADYQSFWTNLKNGVFQAGQFKRVGKGGKEIWIQASYNPIFDLNGRPYKVVKFAADITEQKKAAEIQDRVEKILVCVNAIAEGDFSSDVPDLGTDPVGQIAIALQSAVSSIRDSLVEVASVSGTVALAAQQLSGASREISSGAQTQASSLEETASSLEEITSTVKQNSDNAQQARQLANGSRDIAEKGGAVVSDAVNAMAEINKSSKKIADIITTIDEIAFQTNLLALNAAVEAARAGEQGRGFAVVAAEVRNLAQRSASAAKEIKSLIQDSVSRVENGTNLVNKSGETLSEIVNSVKRVTDIVSEIAAASKEQLTGIEQVNKAVAQMDRVTQANASQTEEVSGTAESLLSHAEQLREEVSKFNLGEDTVEATKSTRQPVAVGRGGARSAATSSRKTTSVHANQSLERVDNNLSQLLEF